MRRAYTKFEIVAVFAALSAVAFVLAPLFKRPSVFDGPRTPGSICQSNLKQIGLAFAQYSDDYDEKFPPSKTGTTTGWTNAVFPYLKSWQVFNCPSAQGEHVDTYTDYFYNSRLAKLSEAKLTNIQQTIMAGDGDAKSSPDYAISSFPARWSTDVNSPPYRHTTPAKYWFFQSRTYGANYLFADGHVKYASPDKITLDKPVKSGSYTFLPQ